ncbi:MAG: sugar ABC transporter permease, partial [Rhizobiales bacterium]|nr:sugar ABC transporter permease [Hyphomicrobiales bacterium]
RLTILGDSSWALWILIAVDAWNWMGLPVLIFTAGLRQIQPEVFEAARLDGAGNGRILWSIALPQLVPSISSLTTLTFINTFNQFDLVYVMQGVQGNPNFATDTLVTYFFRLAFGAEGAVGITDIGLALALGTLLFLLLTVVTIGLLRFFERRTVRL